MALTEAQKWYCYYVIGYVESRNDYSATNQWDPITVGITQWYGQNAWRLLDKLRTDTPDSYAKLSQRLRELTEGGARTWDYWNNIYLLDDDAQSFADACTAEETHAVQDQLFMSDLFGEGGNYDVLKGWGMGDDPKTAIFYLSIYHQRPASASNCMATIGGNASIDALLNWCLSNSILGAYGNRYRTIHDMLSGWDGESEPPDFGQSDTVLPSDPSGQIEDTTLSSTVGYVQLVGNDLIIFGPMSSTSRLVCHNTGKGIWVPASGTIPSNPGSGSTDPNPGPVPPASADDPEDFPAIRQLWYDNEGRFSYGSGGGRLDPPTSGYSDCSAFIWWSQHVATNGKYDWIGTYAETMRQNMPTVLTRDKSTGFALSLDELRPGDCIILDYGSGALNHAGADHAELYMGNGVVWGAGWAPVPHLVSNDITTLYDNYRPSVSQLWVCRWLD